MNDIKNILNEFNAKFSKISSLESLHDLKTEFFGKNGKISSQFKKMGSLNTDERKIFAKHLNEIKNIITKSLETKFKEFLELLWRF